MDTSRNDFMSSKDGMDCMNRSEAMKGVGRTRVQPELSTASALYVAVGRWRPGPPER